MSPAGIFIVLLAFVLANVPFLTQRMLGCLPIPRRCEGVRKHLGWQLAELLAFYCIVGAVSRVLEARAGAVFSQRWPLRCNILPLSDICCSGLYRLLFAEAASCKFVPG